VLLGLSPPERLAVVRLAVVRPAVLRVRALCGAWETGEPAATVRARCAAARFFAAAARSSAGVIAGRGVFGATCLAAVFFTGAFADEFGHGEGVFLAAGEAAFFATAFLAG
jgi:hypothetical protein